MRHRLLGPLLTAAAFFACLSTAGAQTTPPARPTPGQAQELLRTRPDLVGQLQQRLQSSGLTPDQVRARLRAEGYPESLLDQYLPGGAGRGTARDTTSSSTLLDAMEALGIADSLDVAALRRAYAAEADSLDRPRPLPTGARDFPRPAVDTLGLRDADGRLDEPRDGARRDSTRGATRDRRDGEAAADSGLTIFGLDLFRNGSTLFDPNQAGPVDRDYRLGAGDRLVLILTGDVEAAYSLQVTREGFVVVPQVGQLYVANLTLDQLDDLLYARLGRVYSGVRRGGGTTRFSVSVSQLRSSQVFVVGDVVRPGSYRVSSAATALTALYAAGGPSEAGSLRRIEVRRGGRVIDVLDVYDYLLRGDASRDVRLQSGDIVFVAPRLGRVRALGEVLRPATYELRPGETLADLLRAAGGFTAVAAPRQITIERVVPPEQRAAGGRDRTVVTVSADGVASAPALALANGDVVRVARIADRVRNRVRVQGNVWNPGPIGYRPGLRLSDALRAAGGLRPDSYLGRVLVTRLQPDSSRVQLRAILRDTSGTPLEDLLLREDDEVRVFSATSFRPERYVAIGGAVRRGGRFAFRAGMTLRDLVLLAGGTTEDALLTEAEVARLPESRAGGVTATTVRVPLDSSYVAELPGGGRSARVPGLAPAGRAAPEVVLAPYDNVLILRQPDFELQRTVFIGGEVRFPGRYALRSKTERLRDVIARAGGLTGEGNADGVTFYRTRAATGRIGIDLPRVLRDGRARDNFVLQDGDSVVVPTYNPVVRVAGAVNAPVAVAFVPGRDVDYYVRAAGGPARGADLGRAYVTQPNGKLESVKRRRFLPDDVPEVRAGAQVFVPEIPPGDRANLSQQLALFAQVAGTLAALVTALAVLRR